MYGTLLPVVDPWEGIAKRNNEGHSQPFPNYIKIWCQISELKRIVVMHPAFDRGRSLGTWTSEAVSDDDNDKFQWP